MKKLVLLLAFLMAFTSSLAFAEISNGFNGYEWGTDFETINAEKELVLLGPIDQSHRFYTDLDSSIRKSDGSLITLVSYFFINDKLHGGIRHFWDQEEYQKYADNPEKLPVLVSLNDDSSVQYVLLKKGDCMMEIFPWNNKNDQTGLIFYWDIPTFEELLDRRP